MAIGRIQNGKWHVIDKFEGINFSPYKLRVRVRFRCGSGGGFNHLDSYDRVTRKGRVNCKKCRKVMSWDK